jgi:hypothetical protein
MNLYFILNINAKKKEYCMLLLSLLKLSFRILYACLWIGARIALINTTYPPRKKILKNLPPRIKQNLLILVLSKTKDYK